MRKLVLILLEVLVLLAAAALGQEKPPDPIKSELIPPDLVHLAHPGCVINEYVYAETLNAQTGKTEVTKHYSVRPTAGYDDERAEWKATSKSGLPLYVADEKTLGLAADACQRWMEAVKLLAVKEKRRHGK